MIFEKLFLLWGSSWRTFLSLSVTSWLGLIAFSLYRFYRALVTTGAIVLAIPLAVMSYFYPPQFFLILVWLSLIVYLMRPTIGLKNRDYSKRYFSLEHIVCLAAYILFFSVIALFVPLSMRGCVILFALINYSFLYDYAAAIPARCARAFIKSCYFVLYKAPVIVLLAFALCIFEYFGQNQICMIFKLSILYPLLSGLVTIMYIHAIHENYELYYAE